MPESLSTHGKLLNVSGFGLLQVPSGFCKPFRHWENRLYRFFFWSEDGPFTGGSTPFSGKTKEEGAGYRSVEPLPYTHGYDSSTWARKTARASVYAAVQGGYVMCALVIYTSGQCASTIYWLDVLAIEDYGKMLYKKRHSQVAPRPCSPYVDRL